MTGSNVAEQLPQHHVRVVVHGDFTFAAGVGAEEDAVEDVRVVRR